IAWGTGIAGIPMMVADRAAAWAAPAWGGGTVASLGGGAAAGVGAAAWTGAAGAEDAAGLPAAALPPLPMNSPTLSSRAWVSHGLATCPSAPTSLPRAAS